MKFAVLVFPGSNCDRDMYNARLSQVRKQIMLIIVRHHWKVMMAY